MKTIIKGTDFDFELISKRLKDLEDLKEQTEKSVRVEEHEICILKKLIELEKEGDIDLDMLRAYCYNQVGGTVLPKNFRRALINVKTTCGIQLG